MELFTIGFPAAVTVNNLLYCFFGVFVGTFVGVLPGIGAITAVALLLPMSFYLDPTTALIMLAGVYYGSEYGGSTAAILLNLPGSAASAVTCLDGYPMTRQGRAGVALLMTTAGSFVGGAIGIFLMIALSPVIASMALSFGAAEYFSIMLLGLIAAATIGGSSPVKGIAMVVLGLMLGTIGMDVNSGLARFNFGFYQLGDGISVAVVAMGLFGVAEIIGSLRESLTRPPVMSKVTFASMIPTRDDLRRSIWPSIRGAGIGSFFGALPGPGPSVGTFISYAVEKRVAKDPSRFGKGAVEGVVAPEASNNASVQTAFIPSMSLGIPGTATMAILLAGMMMHGVVPGPNLIHNEPEMFWGLIASFWIGNLFLVILNVPMVGLWVRMLTIPYRWLYPTIVALLCMGVFSIHQSVFDVGLVVVLGVLGYAMRLFGYSAAPLVLGFVLGPLLEENLRRAMLLARGDALVILQRPLSGLFLAISLVLLAWMVWSTMRTRSTSAPSGGEA